MSLAPRNWAHALFLWLSLATIFTHALDPGSPLRRGEGSAFNGFTSNVALNPGRSAAPERAAQTKSPGDEGAGQPDALQAVEDRVFLPVRGIPHNAVSPQGSPSARPAPYRRPARAPPILHG